MSASQTDSTEALRLFIAWSIVLELPVAKGDRYTVRLITAGGETVAESAAVADAYTLSYPNGKECDPVCLHLSAKPVP